MKRLAWIGCLLLLLPLTFALSEGDVVLEDDTVEAVVIDSRELKFEDTGDDVAELQARLTELCYYTGNISGNYGEATRAAVMAFQEDFDLDPTGNADAQTQAELYAAMYRPLRYGSAGEDVKRLQTRLMELGYYTGKISGNYLEKTQVAVEEFQLKNGADVTGEADTDTQTVLYGGDAVGSSDVADATATPRPDTGFLVDENAPEQVVATPEETVTYTKRLARGSTGKLVKQLQTRLTELGYYAGPISGNFLGKTTTAVKTLQKQNGLDDDGIVGDETWNLIFNDPTVVLPENTPKPTPEPTPVPFAITVDVTNQVTTVYGRDASGDYTVVVREMLCSTGKKSAPSDVGDWVLNGRTAKWCYFPKWGGHARYWTRINSSIAFHSVIYNTVNTMDMAVSSYKHLGQRASHGCIRLTVADAKWIFDNCGVGTVVTITEDLPADPELVASLKLPDLNYKTMLPYETPEPTAEPVYISGGTPPMPLEKLSKNDASSAVWWMQRKLTELGFYTGKCSGTYLNGTVNAVKAFQKANGLKASGVADVATLEKLYEQELATPTPPPTDTPTPEPIPTPAETDTPAPTMSPTDTPAPTDTPTTSPTDTPAVSPAA